MFRVPTTELFRQLGPLAVELGRSLMTFMLYTTRLLLLSVAVARLSVATTYYVDFSSGSDNNAGTSKSAPWQRVKGMVGCTSICNSTVLADGDAVVFKGGVTWTSVFQWAVVGGTSTVITYTTDHSWYSGTSWTQPVFDDQAAKPPGGPSGGMINVSASNVLLNDMQIQNCDYLSSAGQTIECVVVANASNVSITNCTFSTQSWISVYFIFTVAGSYSNFTFTGNDISHTSNAIWVASSSANTAIHTFNASNNVYHDFHDNMVAGTHGNGFHYFSGGNHSDSTQYMDGVTYCGNRSYGDFTSSGTFVSDVSGGAMTALFFTEGSASGVICNNDFSFSPAQGGLFRNLLDLTGGLNPHPVSLQVYNNSLVNVGINSMTSAIGVSYMVSGDSVVLQNNIASGMSICVYAEDAVSGAALSSDYNLWNCSSGTNRINTTYYNYSQWQALGYDPHPSPSILGLDPSWIAAPGNERLLSGSPAIGAGINLTSLGIAALNSDKAGVARPATGAWDIGAYQYVPTQFPRSRTRGGALLGGGAVIR